MDVKGYTLANMKRYHGLCDLRVRIIDKIQHLESLTPRITYSWGEAAGATSIEDIVIARVDNMAKLQAALYRVESDLQVYEQALSLLTERQQRAIRGVKYHNGKKVSAPLPKDRYMFFVAYNRLKSRSDTA